MQKVSHNIISIPLQQITLRDEGQHVDRDMMSHLIDGSLESPQWLVDDFFPKMLGMWWGPTRSFTIL